MPKKLGVGMPKRRKKKAVALAPAATEPAAASAVAVAKEPLPVSPQKKPAASPARAGCQTPPPSPGALKLKELEAASAKAARELRSARALEKQAEAKFHTMVQVRYFAQSSKMNSIDKAMRRKRRSLSGHKALNKLWDTDVALRTEHHMLQFMFTQFKLITVTALVKLRDAQNAVLKSKLRQKVKRSRVWKPMGRAGGMLCQARPKKLKMAACVERQTVATQTTSHFVKMWYFDEMTWAQ